MLICGRKLHKRHPQIPHPDDESSLAGPLIVGDAFARGSQEHYAVAIDIKEYFAETGFDVLPAIPGRRAPVHEGFLMGLDFFLPIWDPGEVPSCAIP